jgi:chemotaxis protein MotB
VEVGENEVTIRMMGETAVDSGKAEIRPPMLPLLKKIAVILKEQEGEITVVGHTDNVPIRWGQFKSNLGLSMARAASVADYLLNQGAIAPERVSTMGFGEHRPIETNDTPDGRQKNRRVEIKLKSRPID